MTTPGREPLDAISTYRGSIRPADLGATLIHEHLFVRNLELEVNDPDPEWEPTAAIETAVAMLASLYDLGVRSVVDLTVPGLGRDTRLVSEVAQLTPIHLVASTGWYTPDVLPLAYRFRGPGRTTNDRVDPLTDLFIRDISEGIAGSGVRAGMIKVVTDEPGLTPDVERVMIAAAEAYVATRVPITVHTLARLRDGSRALRFLTDRGVDPRRVIIGHAGDSEDIAYLREIMDSGASIGMDRFGMEHVLPDDRRVRTVVRLVELGYRDRLVLSHDAAIYSRVTPPSWRARHAPRWRMDHLSTTILPALRSFGVTDDDLDQLLVRNPARLLAGPAR